MNPSRFLLLPLLGIFAGQISLLGQTTTIIEQWNFTGDSLVGDNGNDLGGFFTNAGNVDTPGNDTWTLNRSQGFGGNTLSGLNLNSSNADLVTMSYTISSWDLSNGNNNVKFLMRLKNDATPTPQIVGTLEFRTSDVGSAPAVPSTTLVGSGYDGSSSGSFLNAGVLTSAKTGSSPFTVGVTLDLANETYTFWVGDPDGDDGSAWENRYIGYTGTIPGLSAQTIDSLSFGFQNVAAGDFVEIDQITLEKTDLDPAPLPLVQIIEQWDYTANSLNSNNGTPMTFVSGGDNLDETGGAKDDTYTVNLNPNFSGTVRTGLNISSSTVQSITVSFTIASWDLTRSGNNGQWLIRLREADNNDVGQLRFMADGTGGTKIALDGEYGQIKAADGGDRNQAIGGLVSAGQTSSSPVTVSLTLDLVNETYALESTVWENEYTAQSTGTIAGLSNAVIDNFSWGWWQVNDDPVTAAPNGDFVELDQIVISTARAPSAYEIAVTDLQFSGSNLIIDFNGTPGTAWSVKGSSTLSGFTDVSGTASIVESPSGVYNATVPVPVSPYFVRFESP
jgi:hypothetical protein